MFAVDATPSETASEPIDIEYRGKNTVSSLARGFDSKHLPIHDDDVATDLCATIRVTVEFPVMLTSEFVSVFDGHRYWDTSRILCTLRDASMRGLNIPETLYLAKRYPELQFAGFGQIVRREWEPRILCAAKGGVFLLPLEGIWVPQWSVPATKAPNPLAA